MNNQRNYSIFVTATKYRICGNVTDNGNGVAMQGDKPNKKCFHFKKFESFKALLHKFVGYISAPIVDANCLQLKILHLKQLV